MTRRPTFSKQLRKIRIKADISQSELARMTGVSRHSIIKYESGENEPEIGNFVLIADALEIGYAATVRAYRAALAASAA